MAELFRDREACIVAMEACGSAHYLGVNLRRRGTPFGLLPLGLAGL